MDMRAAAKATLELACEHGMSRISSDNPELDWPHLCEMVEKMHITEMSEGKLGRWLGWLQAAVVATCDDITLEHMKDINKRFAD